MFFLFNLIFLLQCAAFCETSKCFCLQPPSHARFLYDCSISHLARPHCLRNPLNSAMAQSTLFGGFLKSPVGSYGCWVGSCPVRFMTAQALQSHRRHKHPGASVLAPGGGAPALAVEPRPALAVEPALGGGHAQPRLQHHFQGARAHRKGVVSQGMRRLTWSNAR